MGIFDRFRAGGLSAAEGSPSKALASEHDATRLIEQGHALEASGKIDEAKHCYLEAIKLAPNPARAHLNHGNILLLEGDLKGALEAFRTALKHKPDYAGAHYNLGNALLGDGQFDEAVASYRRALEIQPDYAEVHCSLGVALKELGHHDAAEASFQKALNINSDFVEAHYNLGLLLTRSQKLEDALAHYRRALELKPNFTQARIYLDDILKDLKQVEALYNLGITQQQAGKLDEAAASYRRALSIKPDFVEAYSNLGIVLYDLGQLEDAVTSYRKALAIKPSSFEALCNLGRILQKIGEVENAVTSFKRALEINPDFAEAHCNLGNALMQLGNLNEAATSYRRALELKPDFVEAHSNLGLVLADLGLPNDAVASYQRAIKIEPDNLEVLNNLGNILQTLGKINDAVVSYRRALATKPDSIETHNNLGNAMKDLGQLDDALACYRRALEIEPNFTDALNNLLLTLNFTNRHTPSYYLEQARKYGQVVSEKVDGRYSAWQCAVPPPRLRVGLVSGDLRIHSVGHFLEGLLSHLDPACIELIAYPTNHTEDALTARIRPCFSAWKSLTGMSDANAARLIHADGVHVLLDISGHTAHNRLPVFAWKPAPVQATWLGLPTTTGVSEMDYILGDLQAVPPAHEHHFSETVWRLPDSYLCFSPPAYPVNIIPLPALSSGYVTFGSFNNLTKMNDAVVALWARTLLSVPHSRLHLKTAQLNDASICKQTQQRFAKYGITPDRLLLGGSLGSIANHFAEYNKIDIALDTFPYPGVTTSVEALWMGVPVLSLHGDRFLSLSAKSIAHCTGLPDWVAVDEDEYVAKAVAFSSNLVGLAALRAGLRQQVLASPLFDAPRFARNFEEALWGMWQRYHDQQVKPG
jgi:predicted O-linked N-acetylglucosamine transferase (SPINDLY family)